MADDALAPAAGEIAPLGAATAGVWTRAQALERHRPGTVRGLLRDGVWQVLWPGIYADTGIALSAEQRAFAAVLAGGGAGQPVELGRPDPRTGRRRRRLLAVACGRTAARFWQLPLVDDDDYPWSMTTTPRRARRSTRMTTSAAGRTCATGGTTGGSCTGGV